MKPFVGTPVWKFWKSNDRLETFKSTTTSNAFSIEMVGSRLLD